MTQRGDIDDFAFLTEGSTLVIERWLPGPVERVWRFLTDSDLRRQWFAAGEMTLVAGAPLELVWRNDALSEPDDPRPAGFSEEVRLQSRIIAVDPMHKMTIAWDKGDVTFTLHEAGESVLLTVKHRLGDRTAQSSFAGGWHMHLDILLARLASTKPPSFWSGWVKLQAIYGDRL
jgi:uncharacterized protein YndB with AHSA1/START domain